MEKLKIQNFKIMGSETTTNGELTINKVKLIGLNQKTNEFIVGIRYYSTEDLKRALDNGTYCLDMKHKSFKRYKNALNYFNKL